MGEERFTQQDVEEILDKMKTLTPRQQRLLEALIAVALDAGDDRQNGGADADGPREAGAAGAGNQAGAIVVTWPDGQRRRKFYTYFQRRFARGTLPAGEGPRSEKIGDAIRFDIDGD